MGGFYSVVANLQMLFLSTISYMEQNYESKTKWNAR